MARTTVKAVAGILGANFGQLPNGRVPDLSQWIEAATDIVDQVVAKAAAKRSPLGLSAVTQELIERWVAAYFYCKMDPTYTNKATQGASGTFAGGNSALDTETDRYKRGAIELDWTGVLNALLNRHSASMVYVGRKPLNQKPDPNDGWSQVGS